MKKENKAMVLGLIFGLGNPDKKYIKTYHNAGFLFTDFLAADMGTSDFKRIGKSNFVAVKAGGLKLVKTMSFMNDSGEAVKEALRYCRFKPGSLLVAHDDADIPLGSYKISFGRGAAGHKGVLSVINALKTQNFWRLRIGIRPVGGPFGAAHDGKRLKAGDFVLSEIKKPAMSVMEEVFTKAAGELNLNRENNPSTGSGQARN